MENQNIKRKHIILTTVLVAFALVIGMYIGFKNKIASTQAANINGSLPEELKDQKFFEQFYEVWSEIEQKHPNAKEFTAQEKMWGAISGLVDSLGDPYTVFLPPEENEDLAIDLKGEFSGVGMEVGIREDGLTVVAPLKDSPAEKAGIMSGDIIIKIDDTLTADLDIDKAVDLIRGERGTSVKVTVLRKGEDSTREISIVRDVIKLPIIETEFREKEDVFVIKLFSFNDKSQEKFQEALQEFVKSKSKYLILDLRNNPGGYLKAGNNIASWFLEEGKTIVIEKGRLEEYNKEYTSTGKLLEGKYKMAILVNGGSASASEIVAGALQFHKKAVLIGTQTFGKGSVQELIPMENNTSLKLTIAEWLTPGGISISKNGLTPDYVIEFDREAFKKDNTDNQLEEAIKILKKQ